VTRPTVRLRDVASAAGTSAKTASRVINGDPRVSAETRARVEQAVIDLGYRPDLLARSLRLGRDESIGVVIDSIADPFFASVTGAIELVALERGVTVIVASTQRRGDVERTVVEQLAQRRVSGLIVAPVADDHSYLRHSAAPVVFVDRTPVDLDADAVLVDDAGGARTAVAHLIAHGHRRIAYLGDVLRIQTAVRRLDGFREAMARAGLVPEERLVLPLCVDKEQARAETLRLLDLPDPPTAIFSGNTRCSLGVLPALHARGRTDIAVVGFGDFDVADALTPALTVIDHSPELIGRLAAEHLFRRLDGDVSGPRTTLAELHLVARGSGEVPVCATS
jgi:LacI family transcriptional regulator